MKTRNVIPIALLAMVGWSCASFDLDDREMRKMMMNASPSSAVASYMAESATPPDSLPVVHFQDEGTAEAGPDEPPPDTGTDPRDFAPKFMPYYRYTELENEVKQNELTVFGLIAFSEKFATTYEIPLALEREIPAGAEIGPPLNPNDTEAVGKDTGVGDLNMRFFYNGGWTIGPVLFMPLSELWFPTASEDFLGSGQFQLAPGFALVSDMGFWPYSFAALMNFYQFDVFGDDNRDDVGFYKGRWFFMFPFPTLTYLMPEMQPIYDFETDEFSFWIGPEIGQIFGDGSFVAYMKPGWGIDNSTGFDRDFTFEFGWRWFF